MSEPSCESQCKDAIKCRDYDKVLALLPSLQHHDEFMCDSDEIELHVLDEFEHSLGRARQAKVSDLLELLNGTTKPSTRVPLLHICALLGWITIVQLLITTYNCSPLQTDSWYWIALHYAALAGHLDIVQYFIRGCGIDPMSKSNENVVPLHLSVYSPKELLRGLAITMEMKLNTVKYLVEQCNCDPMVRDSYGNTPLHYGTLATTDICILHYLVNDCHCDAACANEFSNTPVHHTLLEQNFLAVACLKNDLDCHPNKYNFVPLFEAIASKDLPLCQHLISNEHHDPACIDGYGQTPLHVACAVGYVPIIYYLLSFLSVDPLAMCLWSSVGPFLAHSRTPIMVAVDCGLRDEVFPIFQKFGKVRISHSVGSFVNIFFLGDPKAGKTTLTQVIKNRASSFFNFGSVRQVTSSTAGIIPTRLKNTELGNVILHDFAGQPQYYSSHTAVLEDLLLSSGAVFLLLINLTQDVLKQVRFWWSIIKNECSKVSSRCHLIVICSHVDEVSTSVCQSSLALLNNFITKVVTPSNIDVGDVFTLNCCRRSGNSLNLVLKELIQNCASIRSIQRKQISLSCNFLYELIDTPSQNIYTLHELKALCKQAQQQGIPLTEDVLSLLRDLHSSGLIVYLESNHTNSWAIVHKEILLAEVDGILFAPLDFSEHCDIASNTGIITTAALATLFPNYSVDMLIAFLQFMKLCEAIDPSLLDATNLTLKQELMTLDEKILFFPALIQEKRPSQIAECFTIGWCLRCKPG